MNILIIGKGGREHSLVKAMKEAPSVDQVFAFPGREDFQSQSLFQNTEEEQKALKANTPEALIPFMNKNKIQFVIIGPEKELVEGWSNIFRENGFLVFAPSQQAALLEGSKIFAKDFMKKSSIPTAPFFIVKSVHETQSKARNFTPPYVLKADGLAGGKGVFICKNEEELISSAKKLFEQKIFSKAGSMAILEEFQSGYELSIFLLTNGEKSTTLPIAKDFKRRDENHQGPNTGGMGAIAPIRMDSHLMSQIDDQIIKPTIQGLKTQNLDYRGVIYIGIMVTAKGPSVLEYNVRFGDPECQALLPLIDGDIGQHFFQIAKGKIPQLQFNNSHTCLVVLTSPNYPYKSDQGSLNTNSLPSYKKSYFLHAGTKRDKQGDLTIDGGRVLNAVAIGTTKEEAQKEAYNLIHQAGELGLFFRKDIC